MQLAGIIHFRNLKSCTGWFRTERIVDRFYQLYNSTPYLPGMDDYIYAMAMPEDIVEEFKNTYVLYDLSQL